MIIFVDYVIFRGYMDLRGLYCYLMVLLCLFYVDVKGYVQICSFIVVGVCINVYGYCYY